MKVEILNRYSGTSLFTVYDVESLRHALEIATRSGVSLVGADLRGADLGSADLRGADLGSADLRGANLRGADLVGANLEGANLRGADLVGANLRGANLRGANVIVANRSDGYLFLAVPAVGGWRLFAGCHRFITANDARAYWIYARAGTSLGEESLALVDHLERIARILRWEHSSTLDEVKPTEEGGAT